MPCRTHLHVFLIILLALLPLAARAADKTPIKIALVGPMSGSVASFGEMMCRGAGLAVENINAKGGVLGRPLALEIADDACDPKQAVTVANKIVSENIQYVDGHFCSGATMAAMSVYSENNVLMMTPTASNPKIGDGTQWNIFRAWPSDAEEARVAADYIAKRYPGGKIALVDDKQTFSQSIAELLTKELAARGVTVMLRESINPGEKDYGALVTKIISAHPDLFYYSGYQAEAGLIVRQLREHDAKLPIMAADTVMAPDFYAITGKYGEGVTFVSSFNASDLPANQALLAQMRQRNISVDNPTLFTYAVIQLFAQAIAKAGSPDPHKVADVLHHEKLTTALGDSHFDAKGGFAGAPDQLYTWQDGKIVQVKE